MKTNFFFKAVLVIVLAMVTEVSMAQRVVNGINTRDAKACMEYLVKIRKTLSRQCLLSYKDKIHAL